MKVSLILATYNQHRWLEKTLWGYTAQTFRDFELIIADDGSGPETLEVIERFRRETGLRLTHVWHEDAGFRKTEILNRAILKSNGDYLIFSDGDCIPRNDLIATHVRLAEPRRFLSATAVRLPMHISEAITRDDVISGRFADLSWLRAHGFRAGKSITRLVRRPLVNRVADLVSNVPARFEGGNVSTWKEGLIGVNGFDHEMKYGFEDRSLGQRLEHYGYHGKQIRNRAVVFHLDHPRPYKTAQSMQRNADICERIRVNREIRARVGLHELSVELASAPPPVRSAEVRP